MGWNTAGQSGASSGGNKAFVREGNIDVLLIKENKIRGRFLTIDPDIEKIMSEQQLTREQAQEFINTVLIFEEWVMPISHWDHKISAIQGVRFFTYIPCQGRGMCSLCETNDKDRERGVTENKSLSYPVSKKFYVPFYVYELGRVFFVKQSQQFFEEIETYINKHGASSAFEIYKTGKGLGTKYHAIYDGEGEAVPSDLSYPLPRELDFTRTQGDIDKAISGNGGTSKPNTSKYARKQEEGQVNDDSISDAGAGVSAGDFVLPFGKHKGKTIATAFAEDKAYLDFILDNSSGLVKDKVSEFMGAK